MSEFVCECGHDRDWHTASGCVHKDCECLAPEDWLLTRGYINDITSLKEQLTAVQRECDELKMKLKEAEGRRSWEHTRADRAIQKMQEAEARWDKAFNEGYNAGARDVLRKATRGREDEVPK